MGLGKGVAKGFNFIINVACVGLAVGIVGTCGSLILCSYDMRRYDALRRSNTSVYDPKCNCSEILDNPKSLRDIKSITSCYHYKQVCESSNQLLKKAAEEVYKRDTPESLEIAAFLHSEYQRCVGIYGKSRDYLFREK